MSRAIGEMSSAELLEVVGQQTLEEPDALRVLRSPYCTAEVVEKVLEHRRALSSHKVRELVAGFQGLPPSRALHLVATLPWLSMIQLAQSPRVPSLIRRAAERHLLELIGHMALGERIAVARRAHRALLLPLIRSAEPAVLKALLDNARMVENDVLVMLSTVSLPRDIVTAIARHRRWGKYYRIRQALVESSSAPLPVALSAMVQLRRSDVRALIKRSDVGEHIRSAARALIEKDEQQRRGVVRFTDDEPTGAAADTP